jgi:hypothetical protein
MAKSRSTKDATDLRYTLAPTIHTLVPIQAAPGASCTLRVEGDSDPNCCLKAYAGPDGIARFHLRPSWEFEEVAKLSVEIVKDGKAHHCPLHIRSSYSPTKAMPSPPVEPAVPKRKIGRVVPALSVDKALRLTDEEALEQGYPLRPNPDETPQGFRTWLRAVSRPITVVEPHGISNSDRSHGKNKQAGPATSGNWSGFELDRSIRFVPPRGIGLTPPYDWVAGEWNVPAVTGEVNKQNFSAFWVGLDGDGLVDLVQAGTEQDCTTFNFFFGTITSTTYYAWTEFLPQQPTEQVISGLTVNPGDQIYTEVWMGNAGSSPTLAGAFGVFLIMNLTTSTSTYIYTPVGNTKVSGSEAVWIMERPTVGGGLPDLANYGSAIMSSCMARTVNAPRHQGYIAYQGARNQQISMVNGADTLSTVTAIDAYSMRFDWKNFN